MSNTERYHARKLTVKPIDEQLAVEFLEEHHRQGFPKIAFKTQSLGIFKNEELLGVATFTTPRTAAMKRKYTTELLRLGFKTNVRIPGGASKLIKTYIKLYKPSDLFTYQDTSGETTKIYENCGMTLVSQAKKKQYLVAPGKTLATGDRKEILGLPYATRFGPDRILGTKLGELFHSSGPKEGKRKTNLEIFLEDLGWHIEETTGDRIYEWVDFDRTYYTYKITSENSRKYYYGVSHVKKANATIDDCLNDGYYGSGGQSPSNKYSNWKSKYDASLQKEVIKVFGRAAEAYIAEEELIGDAWKDDPDCLNSARGGKNGGALTRRNSFILENCETHGRTKFRNGKCVKCWALKRWSEGNCAVHGKVKFRDGVCINCENSRNISEEKCSIHGLTKHQNGACYKCKTQGLMTKKECLTHGLTIHQGDSCAKCTSGKAIAVKYCEIHGETKHKGEHCYKCLTKTSEKDCPIHGTTEHSGGSCLKCVRARAIKVKECK